MHSAGCISTSQESLTIHCSPYYMYSFSQSVATYIKFSQSKSWQLLTRYSCVTVVLLLQTRSHDHAQRPRQHSGRTGRHGDRGREGRAENCPTVSWSHHPGRCHKMIWGRCPEHIGQIPDTNDTPGYSYIPDYFVYFTAWQWLFQAISQVVSVRRYCSKPVLTAFNQNVTLCEAPESNTIDSGAIQINCIIIIILYWLILILLYSSCDVWRSCCTAEHGLSIEVTPLACSAMCVFVCSRQGMYL